MDNGGRCPESTLLRHRARCRCSFCLRSLGGPRCVRCRHLRLAPSATQVARAMLFSAVIGGRTDYRVLLQKIKYEQASNTEAKWKTSDKKSKSVSLRPIGVCGPSGSGKSTLLKRLLKEYRDCIDFSISHTTRNPRPSEIAGKDYHFVSRSEMEAAIAKQEFLEHAEFSGNLYGTSKNAVSSIQKKGKLCFMDVEMNGVKNLRKTSLNPKFIFVKTPSLQVLEERLRSRNTESEESLQKRLAKAKDELAYGEIPGNFDLIVVNDDLEEAYKQLKEYLLPDIEELKKGMQH